MAIEDYLTKNRTTLPGPALGSTHQRDTMLAASGGTDEAFALRRYLNDGYGGRGGRGRNATQDRVTQLMQGASEEAALRQGENIANIQAGAEKFKAGAAALGAIGAAGVEAFLKRPVQQPTDPLEAAKAAEELKAKALANVKAERELNAPPAVEKPDDGKVTSEIIGLMDRDYGSGVPGDAKLNLQGYVKSRYSPGMGEEPAEANPVAEMALDRVNNLYMERYGKPFFDRVEAAAKAEADPNRKLAAGLTDADDRAALAEAQRRLRVNPQDATAARTMERLKKIAGISQ